MRFWPALAAAILAVDFAVVTLAVGFGFSLAANLLWTWDGGIVRILGGALASCALPGAIHLWPRIPIPPPLTIPLWPGGWALRLPVMRLLRAVVMTAIAGMAAFTTFSHAAALLIAHGEDPLLAALYPIMTELLVVMGVLARHAPAHPRAKGNGSPARKAAPRPAKPPAKTPDTGDELARRRRIERERKAAQRAKKREAAGG